VDRYRRGLDATVRPGGGETFIELLIRSKELLQKLNSLYQNRTVVIFGHGTQLNALRVVMGDRALLDDTGYINWRSESAIPNATPILLADLGKIGPASIGAADAAQPPNAMWQPHPFIAEHTVEANMPSPQSASQRRAVLRMNKRIIDRISDADMVRIKELIMSNRTLEPDKRTDSITLIDPIKVRWGNGEFVISKVGIKGVIFDANEKAGLKPYLGGLGYCNVKHITRKDGLIVEIPNQTSPAGGYLLSEVERDFIISSEIYFSKHFSDNNIMGRCPLGLGAFPDTSYAFPPASGREGDKEILGFMIYGYTGFQDIRASDAGQLEEKAWLSRYYMMAGRALRHMHNAGYAHSRFYQHNYSAAGNLTFVYDLGSVQSIKLDGLTESQYLAEIIISLHYALKKCARKGEEFADEFLRGYFYDNPDVDDLKHRIRSLFVRGMMIPACNNKDSLVKWFKKNVVEKAFAYVNPADDPKIAASAPLVSPPDSARGRPVLSKIISLPLQIDVGADKLRLPIKGGIEFDRKKEFHVTLASDDVVGRIVQALAQKCAAGEDVELLLKGIVEQAADGLAFSVTLNGRYQLLRRDLKISIIALIDHIEGLEEFYSRIEAKLQELGIDLSIADEMRGRPLHTTLFVAGDATGRGISIRNAEDYEKIRVELTGEEQSLLEGAISPLVRQKTVDGPESAAPASQAAPDGGDSNQVRIGEIAAHPAAPAGDAEKERPVASSQGPVDRHPGSLARNESQLTEPDVAEAKLPPAADEVVTPGAKLSAAPNTGPPAQSPTVPIGTETVSGIGTIAETGPKAVAVISPLDKLIIRILGRDRGLLDRLFASQKRIARKVTELILHAPAQEQHQLTQDLLIRVAEIEQGTISRDKRLDEITLLVYDYLMLFVSRRRFMAQGLSALLSPQIARLEKAVSVFLPATAGILEFTSPFAKELYSRGKYDEALFQEAYFLGNMTGVERSSGGDRGVVEMLKASGIANDLMALDLYRGGAILGPPLVFFDGPEKYGLGMTHDVFDKEVARFTRLHSWRPDAGSLARAIISIRDLCEKDPRKWGPLLKSSIRLLTERGRPDLCDPNLTHLDLSCADGSATPQSIQAGRAARQMAPVQSDAPSVQPETVKQPEVPDAARTDSSAQVESVPVAESPAAPNTGPPTGAVEAQAPTVPIGAETVSAAIDADIQAASDLKTTLEKFYENDPEKITYTIRLDTNRIPAEYIRLIKEYYTQILSSDKVEVKVLGNDKTQGLIDVSIDIGGRNDGKGTVDVKGDKGQIESLGRLVGMINLAISVATLPEEFSDSGVDAYKAILDKIFTQYQLLTGDKLVFADPKEILSTIRAIAQNLPPAKAYGTRSQEDFRLMEEKLKSAA
jgi:hypothetical protein